MIAFCILLQRKVNQPVNYGDKKMDKLTLNAQAIYQLCLEQAQIANMDELHQNPVDTKNLVAKSTKTILFINNSQRAKRQESENLRTIFVNGHCSSQMPKDIWEESRVRSRRWTARVNSVKSGHIVQ